MAYSPKTYYIKTFGCQANMADSSSMAGILEALGFEELKPTKPYKNESEELMDIFPNLDLLVVNTCSVRQKSEDKVYGLGRVFSQLSSKNKKAPFAVMSGCMVGSVTGERQRYAFAELRKKTSWANAYINPSQIFELPTVLKEHGVLDEWALQKFNPQEAMPIQQQKDQAYVNISYGCDNFCRFCVVPFSRGREVSRSEKDILFEIQHLVNRGYKNIMLCGQNVNSWGLNMDEKFEIRTGSEQKLPFADLLRKVHEIKGIEKIDFLSSNPFDFTRDLIDAITLPKISNFLHIAVQSGNNEILKKMNRRHKIEDFVGLLDRIKNAKPQVEFGTDIIVGFPGETREQFMDTVKLFQTVKFNVAFISIYSQRKGTPAEKFYKDDISPDEKKWRHAYLTKVWNDSKVSA